MFATFSKSTATGSRTIDNTSSCSTNTNSTITSIDSVIGGINPNQYVYNTCTNHYPSDTVGQDDCTSTSSTGVGTSTTTSLQDPCSARIMQQQQQQHQQSQQQYPATYPIILNYQYTFDNNNNQNKPSPTTTVLPTPSEPTSSFTSYQNNFISRNKNNSSNTVPSVAVPSDIQSRHYHNQHPYVYNSSNSNSNSNSNNHSNTDSSNTSSSNEIKYTDESESSYFFLKRDDPKFHYSNFLNQYEKQELLMSMLSEMAFWEIPSQIRHHRQQQQHQQQHQLQQVPVVPTALSSKVKNDSSSKGNGVVQSVAMTSSYEQQHLNHHQVQQQHDFRNSRFGRNVNNAAEARETTSTIDTTNKEMTKNNFFLIDKNKQGNKSSTDNNSDSTGKLKRPSSSSSATRTEDEEEVYNRELDALDPSKISWRHAVDPTTGRVYYYDSVTRKTQWEKPREIRLLEKKKKRDQRRADIAFFRAMEQNLLASLRRGERIPCVSPDHFNMEGPPCEPTSPPQSHHNTDPFHHTQHYTNTTTSQTGSAGTSKSASSLSSNSGPKATRVRTISGMDQHILAQLGTTVGNVSTSTNPSNSKSSNTTTRNNTSNNTNVRIVSNHDATNNFVGASAGLPLIEGRPPLAQRRASNTTSSTLATVPTAVSGNAHQPVPATNNTRPKSSSSSQAMDNTSDQHKNTSVDDPMDTLELSPDAEDFGAKTIDVELRGVDLLMDDGSIEEDDSSSKLTNVSATTKPQDQSEADILPEHKSQTVSNTNHVRRHTGNTMHFDTTMDNPNIDATMQCVCGVYRAHIVQSAERGIFNQQQNPAFDVFRDDYEQYNLGKGSRTQQMFDGRPSPPPVPSMIEIKAFYREFYQRSQMEHDTIIMSLIYVERLMKDTHGALTPNPYNWRSVLFSCMILASKVWDDLSMWNIDFSNVSVAASTSDSNRNLLSAFSLQRINQLELAVLTNLSFRTAIPASEYAKYYFLIRTMLMRSGILKGINSSVDTKNGSVGVYRTPQQEAEAANRLENRTNHYQETLSSSAVQNQKANNSRGSGGTHRAAAHSIDWSYFVSRGNVDNSTIHNQEIAKDKIEKGFHSIPDDMATSVNDTNTRIGPVLHDAVCLKQIVSSG